MSQDSDLVGFLAAFSKDPLGFVLACFPWGEEGTELESEDGPEEWQVDLLTKIRDGLLTPAEAILQATASGHGIGKSAFVSWIILWAIGTMEDTKGVVTANTETQLKTKTWAEVAKWYRLFIGKGLFHMTATAIYSADPEHERTWRIDMVPWSEKNTEAFAGLHNKGKRILLVFDEASAIPDVIWEVSEGALTDKDTEILWLVFGNPTKNSGRFKECFAGGQFAHRWGSRAIDSRTVSFSNKDQIAKWIQDYGEDSDFVKVRVKGQFPKMGSMQFIASDLVVEAMYREVQVFSHDPFIIGVDVARFGDDESVILFRKGRDARSIPAIRLQGVDTMTLAGRVADAYLEYRADAIFVDGGGVGGGVVDRLRQLRVPVIEVQFGAKSDKGIGIGEAEQSLWANKRAEMWGSMRDWLKGGAIPADDDFRRQLIGPEYSYNAQNAILLEAKADMKKRGVDSPDRADALALTFAQPVIPNEYAGRAGPKPPMVQIEYNPMELELA